MLWGSRAVMVVQAICDWCDTTAGSSTAFDFPTKGILQYAVAHCEYQRLADKDNKPSGEISLLSVTLWLF